MLKLRRFVRANPPGADVVPVPTDRLAAFTGRVPEALIALWRKYGWGTYGPRQLQLLDPDLWQPTLNRWLQGDVDPQTRVPFALTPFGTLIYYRQLTAKDSDIATIDPSTSQSDVLAWDIVSFFNDYMCSRRADGLIPARQLATGIATEGPLGVGEVYEVDQTLLQMQMLKLRRVDALQMHHAWRDLVDVRQKPAEKGDMSVAMILPPEHFDTFAACAQNAGAPLTGLFLSTVVSYHSLIGLNADETYVLLIWNTDERARRPAPPRFYSGACRQIKKDGETKLRLAIELRPESLGSDARSSDLTVMHDEGQTWLLNTNRLARFAASICSLGAMRDVENMHWSVTLETPIPPYSNIGPPAPPLAACQPSSQALIAAIPRMATVTEVRKQGPDDGDTQFIKIDIGRNQGALPDIWLDYTGDDGRRYTGNLRNCDDGESGVAVKLQDRRNTPRVGDRPILRNRTGS